MENKKKTPDKNTPNKSSSPYNELYGKKEKKENENMKGAGDFGSATNAPGPESKGATEQAETDKDDQDS